MASAAEPMAKPLPMAAVVLPTESSLSVMSRTPFVETAHLGDAAGVIRDRAVCIDRNGRGHEGQSMPMAAMPTPYIPQTT